MVSTMAGMRSSTVGRFGTAALWLTTLAGAAVPTLAQCPDAASLLPGLVRLTTTQVRGAVVEGSGFVVRSTAGETYILTVTHVVRGAAGIAVEFNARPGSAVAGELMFLEGSDDNGLALVRVADAPAGARALPLSTEMSADTSQRVLALGSPRSANVRWATVWGDLVGQSGRSISFSGAIDEGSSGGPLLQCGRVVGVVTERADRVAYATPAFLASYVVDGWIGPYPGAEAEVSGGPEKAPAAGSVDEAGGYRFEVASCRALNRAIVCELVFTSLDARNRWIRVVGSTRVVGSEGGELFISETALGGKSSIYRDSRWMPSFPLLAGQPEVGRLRFDRPRENPLGLNPDQGSPIGSRGVRLELHLMTSGGPLEVSFDGIPLAR